MYFGWKIGDQDKTWAPYICCVNCSATLILWVGLRDNRSSMLYAVPLVWREPTNHYDCYFCLTITDRYSKEEINKIYYPAVPSAIRPVPHGEGLPVLQLNWEDVVIPKFRDDDLHTETVI